MRIDSELENKVIAAELDFRDSLNLSTIHFNTIIKIQGKSVGNGMAWQPMELDVDKLYIY